MIQTIAFVLIFFFILYHLVSYLLYKQRVNKIQKDLIFYKTSRLSDIKDSLEKYTCKLNATKKEEILNWDATSLLDKLNKGELTSYDILTSYYERAATIGLELEALADININQAVQMAIECDKVRQKLLNNEKTTKYESIKSLPPLYGLPMSIKSSIEIQNISANLGCARLINNYPLKDGLYLDLLKKLGAIPFISSNIPMCLMINESINSIYGRTKNPWDIIRTPGGSSGGEAALISARCSPLGVGNDIGGSIRIPCLYTGIYGIKVTSDRYTFKGVFGGNSLNERADQVNVRPCNGPIGKSVNDLVLILKNLLNEEMWREDPYVVPVHWNNEKFISSKKLRIGYVDDEFYFPVSPANKRAVHEAINALKENGHELIKLNFFEFEKSAYKFMAIISALGDFKPYTFMIGDEPLLKEYQEIKKIGSLSTFSRKIVKIILRILGELRTLKIFSNVDKLSAWENFKLSEEHQFIKKGFFDWWRNNQIDVLISPGLPTPAFLHGASENLFLTACYTFYFNLLDIPTGAVPITLIKEEEQHYEDSYNDIYTKKCRESLKNSKGLPVGVQVSALPFEEELCLNVMKQIEEKIKFHKYPI